MLESHFKVLPSSVPLLLGATRGYCYFQRENSVGRNSLDWSRTCRNKNVKSVSVQSLKEKNREMNHHHLTMLFTARGRNNGRKSMGSSEIMN